MPKGPAYEAEIRPNDRGGFEIAEPGSPAGLGIGNYASPEDAFAVACYSFDRSKIKAYEPAATVKQTSTLKLRTVKKGGAS